jgi:hypothetical protein
VKGADEARRCWNLRKGVPMLITESASFRSFVSYVVMNLSHIIHEFSFGPYYPSISQPLDMSLEVSDQHFSIFQFVPLRLPCLLQVFHSNVAACFLKILPGCHPHPIHHLERQIRRHEPILCHGLRSARRPRKGSSRFVSLVSGCISSSLYPPLTQPCLSYPSSSAHITPRSCSLPSPLPIFPRFSYFHSYRPTSARHLLQV